MTWSNRKHVLFGASVLLLAGLGVAVSTHSMNAASNDSASNAAQATNQSSQSSTNAAVKSDPITLPEHTTLHVRLNQSMASDRNKVGDHFSGTLTRPVVADKETVIPKGAQVQGIVTEAKKSGRFRGKAKLDLALREVNVNGAEYQIRTTPAVRAGKSHLWRDLEWIGGGGGSGAIIGAIAAGGKGAAIGGPVGAAAGVGVVYFIGRRNVHLPAETPVTFRLSEPATVNAKT